MALAVLVPCCLACGDSAGRPAASSGAFLFEKGRYQALYGPDGKLLRLLYDGNGDRRAEIQTLYGPEGKPASAEIDTDLDGVVDRWERFAPDGDLERVGTSDGTPGRPDVWRILKGGRMVAEELDTDGDGRPDRRVIRGAYGEALAVETDLDRDGVWEKTLPVRREP